MIRRRLLGCAALCAAVVAILPAASGVSGQPALAQSPTAPVVTFAAPAASEACPDCLKGSVKLAATAKPSAGRTIASVAFQYLAGGDPAKVWKTVATDRAEPFEQVVDTTFPDRLNGLFDLRAVATDSTGEQTTVLVRDVAIANDITSVILADPGPALRGTMTLHTAPAENYISLPTEMSFQISRAGAEDWKEVAKDSEIDYDDYTFSADFDAGTLDPGSYDLRAVAKSTDEPDAAFVSRPRRNLLLDREAPVSALQVPAAPLSGIIALGATARDDGGVASVRFERAPAGSGSWTAIASRGHGPYTVDFDTRILADGAYDFRVVATDQAGNAAASPPVEDVLVANPERVPPVAQAVTNLTAPATNLKLLGTTTQGETWATGVTSGPPAVVDGHPLVYTTRGQQLVLLRYTDAGGWQIRDVLRNDDAQGTAFDVSKGAETFGQMTPSGEAWIAVRQAAAGQPTAGALFHRSPGRFDGQFRRDDAASKTLMPLLTTAEGGDQPKRLQVGQVSDGRIFGILVVPNQNASTAAERASDGTTIQVGTALAYGELADGAWQLKQLPRPRGYAARDGDVFRLTFADLTGPATGWVAVDVKSSSVLPAVPPRIGRLSDSPWDPIVTGLDALDGSGEFAVNPPAFTTTGLRAEAGGVWIGAKAAGPVRTVVAHYEEAARRATRSWCDPLGRRTDCGAALGDAVVPDQVFTTPRGPVAVALATNFVHTFQYGDWTRSAAPGFAAGPGRVLLGAPDDGWLAGPVAFGRLTAARLPDPMTTWPQSNRSTLLSVALPPGSGGAVTESGALAVGLDGTVLGYGASTGWQIQNTPAKANRLTLRAVAFSEPGHAFAVGGAGIILRWDGASWTEDPQSTQITGAELQGLAFDGSGQGWAVGRFATILHFDGTSWSPEQPPAEDAESGATISSVTVAGDDVFAISDGNLIQRGAGGQWHRVERSDLPDPDAATLPFDHELRVVSGLPDGGVVAAGRSVVLVRQQAGGHFAYADQPIAGIAVAASAFRDRDGVVRAFVSSAAPLPTGGAIAGGDIGGFPAGDGVLLRQTADGWVDLSHSQTPIQTANLTQLVGDGLIKPDPVLAVAASPDGEHAWAVGGYAGTRSAAGQGLDDVLPARPSGWRTAHVWRYDTGGSAVSPADVGLTVSAPAAVPDTVTFAYFSNVQCRWQCAGTEDAQPDVNLREALGQINQYAQQPGGPAFAVLGGNARGPVDPTAFANGNGQTDLQRLPSLLAPLGNVPLFAVAGPRDHVVTHTEQLGPWADAFAQAPAPFGSRPAPRGITPVDKGAAVGAVHRYYAFDATQNGSVVRAIVLDNSTARSDGPALDADQDAWFDGQLSEIKGSGVPTVVFLSQPLNTAGNDDHLLLALRIIQAGVLAVVVPGETNDNRPWPSEVTLESRIPLISGATLGYQQSRNNGVSWYSISIDVRKRLVSVEAKPLIDSLALKPLIGLTVARSQTLAFEAVGRRPSGTLATTPNEPTFPGFDNYLNVPAPATCVTCVVPNYTFTSSDPTIGDFVLPSGLGSRYPLLSNSGTPVAARSSGLFCAYNSGTTTISVTVGSRRASLPVTVLAGGFGRPCGTVFRAGVRPVVLVPSTRTVRTATTPSGSGAPPPPPPTTSNEAPPAQLPNFAVPFPAPLPVPAPEARPTPPKPRVTPPLSAPPVVPPVVPPPNPPPAIPNIPPVAVPPVPPNIQPIPPGGSASAQAAARRKEKAQKHASQSAFTTHDPGVPWFYAGVGAMSLLTLLLVAGGMRPDPRRRAIPAAARVESRRPRGGR